MSRDVLLNVSSSAIEFAEATIDPDQPDDKRRPGRQQPARQLPGHAPSKARPDARATGGGSSVVEVMFRAMATARRRSGAFVIRDRAGRGRARRSSERKARGT